MKNIIILVVSTTFILFLNSCNKLDEFTKFTIAFDQETTIDATIPIPLGILKIPTPNITTNSETTFESENTKKDLVEEATLTKLTLSIITPNGEDFSFLESAKIYITADGLSELMIASNTDIPAESVVELYSEGQNLVEYIKKDVINLRIETITDEIITQDYTISIHSEFFIDAKILGI